MALDDLVLHDADTAPTVPSSRALAKARARLVGPARPRPPLPRRQEVGEDPALDIVSVERDADAMVESRVDDWLCRVEELRPLRALPAAVLALHAWPMIAPLAHGSSAVSRLLIPAILRGHGKTTSHDLYLSVGLQQI